MCQMTFANTHNVELNREIFLVLSALGGPQNDDGWGFCDTNKMFKTDLASHFIPDAGTILLRDYTQNSALMGHIRAASPQVPVTYDNTHPFLLGDVFFQHNGKLTPRKPEDFTLEYDTEVLNTTSNKMEKRTFKISDSLLFFQEFSKIYADKKSVPDSLVDAMNLFYGKFAFMLGVGTDWWIVRGKTADLHISYILNGRGEKAKTLGYVVNTNASVLDIGLNLVSNLRQLRGEKMLYYTFPSAIKEETIFKAGKFNIEEIAPIKEVAEPTKSYYSGYTRGGAAGAGNFSQSTTGTSSDHGIKLSAEETLISELHDFRKRYSLSLSDISDMFFLAYNASLLEIQPELLKHFLYKIAPMFSGTNKKRKKLIKDTRKAVTKAKLGLSVSRMHYMGTKRQFPWMLWEESEMQDLTK